MIGKQYEYDRMAACEEKLWWYRCLHATTLEKIKKYSTTDNPSILDAGCGTGGLLSVLHQNGFTNCQGFDLSEDAVRHTLSTYGFAVKTLNILQAKNAFDASSFDVIVSNDVICLLPEIQARQAFQQLVDLLKPGGLLLLNLPAIKFFRGTHDIAVGIQQRYTKQDIHELVRSDAEIKEMTYWPFLLSPLIFITRFWQRIKLRLNKDLKIISDVSLPASFINESLYNITSVENKLLADKPWGSSLFIVLQKKAQ